MSVTTQVYDAAHKYGLDSMGVTAALITAAQAIQGSLVRQTNSWGDGPITVGQPGTISVELSGGFTQTINLVFSDETRGVVTGMTLYRTSTNELLASSTGSVPFTAATWGSAMQPQSAFGGNDTINGNSFNNIVKGFAGSDRIDGGAGTDVALYEGFSSQYTITRNGAAMTVAGQGGTDTLLNIERLHFDDKAMAYDISGTGGAAYRLYQAAFNRTPDAGGLGYWISVMDKGTSLGDVAAGFVNSTEFTTAYGANPSSADIVNKFYTNVLHRAGETAGVSYWAGLLDSHSATPAQVLAGFSESPENQAGLIGVIGNGFAYTPYG